jgi:hypothetical protein
VEEEYFLRVTKNYFLGNSNTRKTIRDLSLKNKDLGMKSGGEMSGMGKDKLE